MSNISLRHYLSVWNKEIKTRRIAGESASSLASYTQGGSHTGEESLLYPQIIVSAHSKWLLADSDTMFMSICRKLLSRSMNHWSRHIHHLEFFFQFWLACFPAFLPFPPSSQKTQIIPGNNICMFIRRNACRLCRSMFYAGDYSEFVMAKRVGQSTELHNVLHQQYLGSCWLHMYYS